MLFQTIVLSFVALTFGAPGINRNNSEKFPPLKIVGGHDVDIKDYPYQVSVMFEGSHRCGGSIIDQTHILTAAHCLYGKKSKEFQIRTGSSRREEGGIILQVLKTYVNPSYVNDKHDYDVGVLELSEPLEYGPGIGAIKLADSELPENTEVEITGWGLTEEGGHLSEQLQGATIPIVGRKKCRSLYINDDITDRMICAGLDKGGKDTCQSDSGGPLARNGVQYGIVSWGYGCGEAGHPGVYSSVSSLRDFIDSIVS